jgi:hypothetical protein
MTLNHTQRKTARRPSRHRTPVGKLIRAGFLEFFDPIRSCPGRFFDPVVFSNSCMKGRQRPLYARDSLFCVALAPATEGAIDSLEAHARLERFGAMALVRWFEGMTLNSQQMHGAVLSFPL